MTNTNLRSDGRFMSGMFFHVLPAQIILLLLTGINNIVDGLVGSNFFGPTAASVIGLYAPFQTIWVGTGVVLMVGSQVLCARYMGSGDLPKIRGIFSLNITLTVAIMSVATVLSFTLASPIAATLGASPVNADDLTGYIVGRGIGLIPMILASQLVAFLSLEGKDNLNYIATGAMIVVNVGLDLLFAITFKSVGIAGLGIATAISQWVYDEDDKEWYWLDETGSIPLVAGVADDGDTYNAFGQWIDVTTEGTPYKFITKEDFEKIKEGMTYEEVVGILGAYHEYSSSEETMIGNEKVLVESLTWYTEKAKGYGIVTFKNDIVALTLPMFDMNWDF